MGEKKKWDRPTKGASSRTTLVSVVLSDGDLAKFRAIQEEMGCNQSEAMRMAFDALCKADVQQANLVRSHQIGLRVDSEELAELERMQEKMHTSKSGVFKHAIALMHEKLTGHSGTPRGNA